MKRRVIFILVVFSSLLNVFGQSEKRVAFISNVEITNSSNTQEISVVHLIPNDIEGRQKIEKIDYSIQPVKVFEDNGCKYAQFKINSPGGNKLTISIAVRMKIYQSDLKTIKQQKNGIKSSVTELDGYLRVQKYLEIDDPLIKKIASKLKGKNNEETAKKTYNYVMKSIKYSGYISETLGAKCALSEKKGDCTEFAMAFVALCRANDVPARRAYGYVSQWKGTPKHDWAEYYHEKLGWIPIDPTVGNGQSFSSLLNKYVYLSNKQEDETLENYSFFYYRYLGARPNVKDNLIIHEVR